jgi:nucleoside-diphosphate-sugar epimerase
MTSTTSAFGDALKPPPGEPAAWIDESVAPVPKNIYGVTKTAAEDLCRLFHRNEKLACVVLRTSRFFPEEDDDPEAREAFADDNAKVNEFLFRRAAIEDVVDAHLLAAERAPAIGFGKYIVSATTPFRREDLTRLRADAPAVVRERAPDGKTNTRGEAGGCSPASTGSMTTRSRAANSGGGRNGTLAL